MGALNKALTGERGAARGRFMTPDDRIDERLLFASPITGSESELFSRYRIAKFFVALRLQHEYTSSKLSSGRARSPLSSKRCAANVSFFVIFF